MRSSLSPSDVVGRDQLITRCLRHLDDDGDPSLLVLSGEAGIGKTTILDAVANHLPVAPLRIAGSETESVIPYGALAHLVAEVAPALGMLTEPFRTALLRALGEEPGRVHLLSVGRGAAALLAEAGRPLLIDDGHWVDPASRRALVFALRAQSGVRAVAATRPGDVANELAGGARLEPVRGLSGRDLQTVIERRVVLAARHVLACRGLAKGNPLTAIELARAFARRPADMARGDLAPDIDELLMHRVAALPPATQRALGALALSTGQHLATVLSRLGLDARDLAPAEAEGLLTDGWFTHPLLRSVTETLLDRDERSRIHAALGDQAENEGDADRATWHQSFAGAEPSESLAERLEEMAQRAWRRGAAHEARLAWERSFAVQPRAEKRRDAVVRAAHKAWVMGDVADATRLLAGAAGPADNATAVLEELTRGQLELWTDRPLDALRRFERAHTRAVADLVGATGSQADRLRTYAGELGRSMVAAAVLASDDREAARLAATAAAACDALWPPAVLIELQTMQTIVAVLAEPHQATIEFVRSMLGDVEQALAGAADEIDGPRGTAQIVSLIAMLVESDDAAKLAQRAAQDSDRAGLDGFASISRAILAELFWRCGRWREAEVMLDHLISDTSPPILRSAASAILARVVSGMSGPSGQQCQLLAEEAITIGQATGLWLPTTSGYSAIGLRHLAVGNAAAALAALDVAWAVQQRSGFTNPAMVWFAADRAEAMLRARELQRLEPFLRELDEMASAFDSTYLRSAIARIRAERDRCGLDDFELALAGFRSLGAEFEVARTWLAAARVGTGPDHDKCLAEARAGFAALDAGLWVIACDELAARRPHALPVQLTAREADIVRLIADGHTNDQIARHLHLSVKTVEKVLTALYRRADLPNRAAVAAAVSAGALIFT
jgi:DNA-binding CsgD family transcriptional regulator